MTVATATGGGGKKRKSEAEEVANWQIKLRIIEGGNVHAVLDLFAESVVPDQRSSATLRQGLAPPPTQYLAIPNESAMSKRHVQVSKSKGMHVFVMDLWSANGTYVSSNKILKCKATHAYKGDRIQLDQSTVQVE